MDNTPTNLFQCVFCMKRFSREASYLKHRCRQMERNDEMRTMLGQSAFSYYEHWMKSYNRNVPSPEVFLTSKYYTSFIKFAKYVKDLNIPDVEVFIALMKEKDISPMIWTDDQVYALYLEYLDKRLSPIKQAALTIDTLFKLADALDCDVSRVFHEVHPIEILQLIRERRISPWLLMHSVEFKKLMIRCTPEQRALFEGLIRPQYWKYKFDKNPEIGKMMKKYAEEMNI